MFYCSRTERRKLLILLRHVQKGVSGLQCGETGPDVVEHLGSFIVQCCVRLGEPVLCTDTVCIFLYRPVQNLDH